MSPRSSRLELKPSALSVFANCRLSLAFLMSVSLIFLAGVATDPSRHNRERDPSALIQPGSGRTDEGAGWWGRTLAEIGILRGVLRADAEAAPLALLGLPLLLLATATTAAAAATGPSGRLARRSFRVGRGHDEERVWFCGVRAEVRVERGARGEGSSRRRFRPPAPPACRAAANSASAALPLFSLLSMPVASLNVCQKIGCSSDRARPFERCKSHM